MDNKTKPVAAQNLVPGMRTDHTEIVEVDRLSVPGFVRVKTTSRTGYGFAGARYYEEGTEIEVLDGFVEGDILDGDGFAVFHVGTPRAPGFKIPEPPADL